MSSFIQAANVSEAWLRTLQQAYGDGKGRTVHLVTSIADPTVDIPDVRDVVDQFLRSRKAQTTDTVSETIYPESLYTDPGFDWHPGISPEDERELDAAAADLFDSYIEMLPTIRSAHSANSRGTYFGRMVHWPGTGDDGVNQLALRIEWLRSLARRNVRTNNTLDIDLAADSLDWDRPVSGIQVYAVTDTRIYSFPCLTHLDLTLYEGTLHCTAVYRHQYLVQKAYGNLLGLGNLMRFLCQQTGLEVGELVVHATMADSEGHKGTADLIAHAESALLQADVSV